MSVHYKFKSALEYDTVTFDGLHISVKELKKAILQQKKVGKTLDFDLQVTNAQTKETYTDENVLIPKNASLIIARVPLTQQQKKQYEKEKLAANNKLAEALEQGTLSQVDISSLNVSEEEKIKTMMSQSTSDYDPSNYVKMRGGNQIGTVPASYICFKCHQHGHWIKDCPSTIDSANMGMIDTIRKSTGIPRSFMIEVEGPQVPGARMTPSGGYAVPAIDHEVYKEKKIEKPPFLAEKEKPPPAPTIPEDLICGICKDLLQDAVMIPCCGISFCDECIRNVLVDSEESECPDCNEKNVSPDTLIPNRFLRNSVNTFKNKTGYVKNKLKLIQQRPPSPPRPSLPDFVPPPDSLKNNSGQGVAKSDSNLKDDSKPIQNTKDVSVTLATKEISSKKNSENGEKDSSRTEKLKKAGIDVDDISSVSSNASEEPPPPVENRRLNEGQPDPSQGPSYAIPSLFSGHHPIILPPRSSEPYPLSRAGDNFVHSGTGGERSGTPTVDERLEIPPVRPLYDPYRPPNYMMPGFDQQYGMLHSVPMPYDPNMMYDRGYRGMPRGPRMHRGRYAMRQPPPPGSRPLSPPRNEEEAYLAFQRMLKEKEERDKRKNEKLKSRRSTSRSRSRSATRSRRSFSGARSRSRSRSRTPLRRSRSRSKKKSRTRSRSFVISRSRSRSYSRSPLHERNYSPKKYYSPHRSPVRYDRYDSNYMQWNQDHRDYRRSRYRGRGRGRFYKNSPPRSYDHQSYNRNSRDREYRSYERETDSAARDHNGRRRSHSNSPLRNLYDSERERDKDRAVDKPRDRDRENEYRRRSRSRRSKSRRYTPARKLSRDRSKDKSPDRRKDWNREKDESHRSRERRSFENEKDNHIYSKERDRSKDYDRYDSKRRRRSHSRSKDKSRHVKDRSRSKDQKKRSLSRDKQREKENSDKKQRSSSRRRSLSRPLEEKAHSPASRSSKDGHKNRSVSLEKEKHNVSARKEELDGNGGKENRRDTPRASSPKVADKEDEDKKEKKKDKEKKKKKKEKETDEERTARKKKKKEKKEEKKKKQEMKNKTQTADKNEETHSEGNVSINNAEFVSSFKAAEPETEENPSPLREDKLRKCESDDAVHQEQKLGDFSEPVQLRDNKAVEVAPYGDEHLGNDYKKEATEMGGESNLEDDNSELQIHASYESLLEETLESQKKGILAPVPEISKWELDENQVSDSNHKTFAADGKSPENSSKVTREVIKRAENAIFKKAVNAIREPIKRLNEKEEKKERKVVVPCEKEKSKEHARIEVDGDKTRRVFLTMDREKVGRSGSDVSRSKSELKRTANTLQITVPVNSGSEKADREFLVEEEETKGRLQKEKHPSRSPPPVRVPIKERLGSKIEKPGRHPSPQFVRTVEKRGWNEEEEEERRGRKNYPKPTLSCIIESVDAKRSSIDEAHFIPNYDESSDEEQKTKRYSSNDREGKFGGSGDAKKRFRSSSESSDESAKKHKRKKSKTKKKKQRKSKKRVSDSSEFSDSDRDKKKHKKSKKKKKSKH